MGYIKGGDDGVSYACGAGVMCYFKWVFFSYFTFVFLI